MPLELFNNTSMTISFQGKSLEISLEPCISKLMSCEGLVTRSWVSQLSIMTIGTIVRGRQAVGRRDVCLKWQCLIQSPISAKYGG